MKIKWHEVRDHLDDAAEILSGIVQGLGIVAGCVGIGLVVALLSH